MIRFILFAAALALWVPPARAAEIGEVLDRAYADFLAGRLEESAKGYRYLEAMGIAEPGSEVNLAALSRDLGRHDAALPLWTKASLLEGADGFVWNQRGWAYLAVDRPSEAKESFLKAVERSSSTATMAEANLGLGMAALQDARPKAAMAPLRDALVQGPYMIPAAAYQTGLTALAMGEKQGALAYFRQSIEVDPMNFEPLKALARLQQKTGQNEAAWRTYRDVLSLDPADSESLKNLKQVLRYIPENMQAKEFVRRIARPMLDETGKHSQPAATSSETIRVALFSGSDGKPSTALRLYFVVNAAFRLIAANGDVVKEDGRAGDQWEITYRPENNLVEVRDNGRIIQYTSKLPFRIAPSSRLGSVLIKSGEFVEPYGFDPGDREVRGSLEIVPTPAGFKLVNELFLEDYLYGVVASALPLETPIEAYKAQAVVSRTRALWRKGQWEQNPERTDICDSEACQRYRGLTEEMIEAVLAVNETEGVVLKFDGRLTNVPQHKNSGGVTEAGAQLVSVHDGPGAAPARRTPIELERWLHDRPARDLYCEASSLVPAAESRWIRILDGDDLKERAERVKFIGRVVNLRTLQRSPTGRVLAMEVEGTNGEKILLQGQKAVMEFLSPRSLRSTLFTVQPLMKGGHADRFILWGAGTGDGLGMSEAGAIGQASLGRSWKDILSLYFPAYKLDRAYGKPPPSAGSRGGPANRRRPKNPRKKN